MHPELTLITQNKNLALTFAETGFAMSSVPILAQHKLHAVAEGEVLLTADGMVPTIEIPIVIVDVRNVLHMVRLCELIRRILAVQPRTLQYCYNHIDRTARAERIAPSSRSAP